MIKTPDRIGELVAAIERGEPVNFEKVAALQALDLVQVGRRFVEEAITEHERCDEQIRTVGENALSGVRT